MTFFSRPNLDDTQFKQLSGSTLTLEGAVQIASVTGLTIVDDYGTFIPIIVTGATNNDVLTYNSATCQITLQPSSGGGSGVYSGASPTTCTVGGLVSGSNIFNQPISTILQSILVPTVAPVVQAPSLASFTLSPSTLLYEVGCQVNICATMSFNQGYINPLYCGSSPFVSVPRSGVPNGFVHVSTWYGACVCPTNNLSNTYSYPLHCIQPDNNTFSGSISYNGGTNCVFNSACVCTGAAVPAGSVSTSNIHVVGINPWFWGKSATLPVINQTLINNNTCKCVGVSTGAITVDNFNASGQYIWIAIPFTSTSKTCWQGANNPSNNGTIPGTLFPTATCMNITSPQSCWGSTCYKIYVSSYATSVNYGMTFCN